MMVLQVIGVLKAGRTQALVKDLHLVPNWWSMSLFSWSSKSSSQDGKVDPPASPEPP